MNYLSSPSLTALGLAAVIALGGCESSSQATERVAPQPAVIPSASPPSAPSAQEPEPAATAELAGDLRPSQAANLSFKVGGRLSKVRVVRGQQVKRGEVLAALVDTEARATLAQAEAAVAAARAQAALAEDAERRVAMLGNAEAVSSSAVSTARLTADAARAGIAQARAGVALARANLDNHVLVAPFDGVVVQVPDGVGETVGPGAPIVRVENLDVLLLRATASEDDARRLTPGAEVLIRTSTGKQGTGRVRSVLGSLEPVSRRAPVEIEVPNQDRALAAGAYVRVLLTPVPTPAREASQ